MWEPRCARRGMVRLRCVCDKNIKNYRYFHSQHAPARPRRSGGRFIRRLRLGFTSHRRLRMVANWKYLYF